MKRIVFLGKAKESSTAAWHWLHRMRGPSLEACLALHHDETPTCDLLVSFLYPRRVPHEVLVRAKSKLNFHPAPLPKYRGLWGCSRAILDGESLFGVAAHVMTEEIDAGDVVAERFFPTMETDTAQTLDHRAQQALLATFKDVVLRCLGGETLPRKAQPEDVPPPPTRAELEAMKCVRILDDAEDVDRKARAFWYPPYSGAQIEIDGEYFTIAPRVVAAGRDA